MFRTSNKFILRLLALAALVVPTLIGCGTQESEQEGMELVMWHAYRGGERAALEEVIGSFNAENADRGVRVRLLAVPFDAYADKLSAALPQGKGPDLFIFAQDRLGGWVESGKTVEPIGFYLNPTDHQRFLPGMVDALTYRGAVYGVPLNFKSLALIRNADLAPTEPQTTDELAAAARAFMVARPGEFGLSFEYANPDFQGALFNAFGGGVVSDRGEAILDREQNRKAFELLLKWRDEDKILLPEPTGALVLTLYNEERTPFVISGPWFLGEVDPALNTIVSPLPIIPEADGAPIRPWLLVEGVFVSETAPSSLEAFRVAQYLTSPEAATIFALKGRQLPTIKAIYDDPRVMNDPILSGFRQQQESSAPLPNIPEMAHYWTPGTTAMTQVLRSGRPPADALAEAQAEMDRSIAEMRRSGQ